MPFKDNYLVQCPPDDLVIWRYMDLPKFLIMLEQRNLYFALLEEFEDKWEAVISRELSRGIQIVSGAASGTVIDNYEEIFKNLAISCWYSGQDESIAMWRLYTTSVYGVAIKSTVGLLKRALEFTEADVHIGTVRYQDHTEPPSETLAGRKVSPFEAALQKRTCYKHECEVRAITQTSESTHDLGPRMLRIAPVVRHGVALPINLSTLIHSVTTGPKFPHLARTLLDSAIQRAGINPLIVESNAFKEPELRHLEP